MRKVKWGILGPGNIAADFVSDFQFVPNGEVVAVASRSVDRAQAFASRFDIPKVYDDYARLVGDAEVEAIYVATPHSFHFEQTRLALEAGKAVLCEKPITTKLADFEVLRDLANEKKLLLMEGMWTYFLPAIRKAREWVNSGKLGKVLHVKSDFGFKAEFDPDGRLFNPKLAGGALFDIGIYPLALTQYFLGSEVVDLEVRVRKAPTGVDSDVSIWMKYPGALATLHSTLEARLPNKTFVIGEQGYLEIPNGWMARECLLYNSEGELIDHFNDGRQGFGFNFECESFNACFLEGEKQSEIMPHRDSLILQEWMEKVFQIMGD